MEAKGNIPRHVAIIMDGNGRWARRRGLDRVEGHVRGVESVRTVVRAAVDRGVEYLTLYTFSTENWGRPAAEVDALMGLICRCVREETPELVERGVRVTIIGDRDGLPEEVRRDMAQTERETASGTALTLILALNYSSRTELARAARLVAERGGTLEDHLYTAGIPDPDLLIRTGGDVRLSNFLLWQAAYSELWFTPEYWPDFDAESLDCALREYAVRERRYGLITEQKESKEKDEK